MKELVAYLGLATALAFNKDVGIVDFNKEKDINTGKTLVGDSCSEHPEARYDQLIILDAVIPPKIQTRENSVVEIQS